MNIRKKNEGFQGCWEHTSFFFFRTSFFKCNYWKVVLDLSYGYVAVMILRQLTELCVHDFGAFRLGCETLKKVYFRERNLIRSLWPFPHIHLGPCRLPESPGYQPRVRCGRWRRRPATRADSGREESHQLKFTSPITARCSG